MKKIAVLFGGKSVEHDVSIITGVLVSNCIKGYEVIPVYINKDNLWYSGNYLLDLDNYKNLNYKKLRRVTIINGDNSLYEIRHNKLKSLGSLSGVINCMHGGIGENGSVAGLLNCSNICNLSPDVFSSSLTMNKAMTKIFLKGMNIKSLPYKVVDNSYNLNDDLSFDYPYIVKPLSTGSSIGISVAKNYDELSKAVNLALKFDNYAMIEPKLSDFTEINCACYKDEKDNLIVSQCEKPVGKDEVLSFDDKYEGGKREFPANISKTLSDKVKDITKRVYSGLNFNGVIRVDYFIKDNKVYLNEINSVPGSLSYYLFGDEKEDFVKMINSIIKAGEKGYAKSSTTITSFDSGILLGAGSKGAKRL